MSTFRNRLWSKRGYLTFYWYYEGYKLSRCGNFGLVFSVLSRYPLAMLWCLLVRSDGRRGLAVRTDKKKEKNKSLRKTRQTNAPWWTMQNCNCTCLATLFHEGLWKTITIIIIVHDLENFNITLYYFRNEFFVSNSSPLKMVLKCYFYSRLFIKGLIAFAVWKRSLKGSLTTAYSAW